MKTTHLIGLFVVLWAWDRYNQSHNGMSAIDASVARESANFAGFQGTNFTNSVWDPLSGQPSYQFGTINAPGGAGITQPSFTGAFGHM